MLFAVFLTRAHIFTLSFLSCPLEAASKTFACASGGFCGRGSVQLDQATLPTSNTKEGVGNVLFHLGVANGDASGPDSVV